MTSAEMQNNLFDSVINGLTQGVIPDMQAAATFAIVCFVGYIVVDLIWGQAIEQWWDEKGEQQEYKRYKKNREKSERFRNTYSSEHDFNGPIPEVKTSKPLTGPASKPAYDYRIQRGY